MNKHGMTKHEVDMATNTRQHLPRNYWTSIYGGQMPGVPKETDVAGSASVATIATTVSTVPTTAPSADPPGSDAL